MTYNPDNRNDHQRSAYPGDNRGMGDPRGPDPRAPDEDGPLLPEGDYPVKAVKHRMGFSGNENEQIGILLNVTDGEYKGRRLLYYGTFTDAGMEFTIKAMRALGMQGDDIERDAHTMYTSNAQAVAVVQHETYQGKTRAKVKWINGADVVMKHEMNPNELSAFSKRMKANFARYGSTGGSAPRRTISSVDRSRRRATTDAISARRRPVRTRGMTRRRATTATRHRTTAGGSVMARRPREGAAPNVGSALMQCPECGTRRKMDAAEAVDSAPAARVAIHRC